MPIRMVSVLLAVVAVSACSGNAPAAQNPFTRVDVSGVPLALAADGDALLIGVRKDNQAGLLRRAPDGTVTEIAVRPGTPYGREARWVSFDSDGTHIVGLGGERGGAHGNERWSAWLGSATGGIAERMQAFSTFGGYGAGELIAAVRTPAGPALVGTWQSNRAGLDVAVWTGDADNNWTRLSSAGTALESTPDALNFPIAAAGLGPGILVAGWQLAGGTQRPVVWRSGSGVTGWELTPLPDAGRAGAGMSVRCWETECALAGRVDGKLAIWQLKNGTWTRLSNVPAVSVGDKDHLAAPVEIGGRLTQAVAENGQVKIAQNGGTWALRPVTGPTGTVTATAAAGGELYLLCGTDEDTQTLWRGKP